MTDKVKRYDLVQFGDYSSVGVMEESENGDWIRAEDYDDLRRRDVQTKRESKNYPYPKAADK